MSDKWVKQKSDYSNGYELGKKLQKALNLPPFSEITFHLAVNGVINANVTFPLTLEHLSAIGEVFTDRGNEWKVNNEQ